MRWQILFLLTILVPLQTYAWKMEADSITVNNTNGDTVTHITFRQTFDTTPLVFTLMDDKGGDPSTLRVTNVTTTGFDIYTVEPDGEDGPHTKMTKIPYIAIEPGDHTLPDGTKILAQTINTQKFQSKRLSGDSWETISLSGFTTDPVVLGQIQTRANERTDESVPDAVSQPWMTTAIKDISSSGFDVALERSETTDGNITSNETIAYLVMESGLNGGDHYFGSNDGTKIEYETIRSSDSVQGWDDEYQVDFSKTYHDPVVVATKNTRDGVDGGWLRRGDIDDSYITLQVDEDQANDSERGHTTERAGILIFSDPFSVNFISGSGVAELKINEVMYNETVTGTNNDEFVELYVVDGGDIEGTILSDQDQHFYRFPSCSVSTGDYVIMHTGSGTNSCGGNVHHFYQGVDQYWNNSKDDVLLLMPDMDVTTTTQASNPKVFNAIPYDYIAYGSLGDAVDDIPSSMHGTSIGWDDSHVTELDNAGDGVSIALTPNATDGDTALCWEFSASGNASDNSCTGYIPTRDTNSDTGQTNSITLSNTAMPNMSITKTSIVTNDPVNANSNPKRIPGATIRYCFTVDNTGDGDAEDVTVTDSLTGNGKDNLSYGQSGSLVQDISTACDCAAITATNGTISGSDVTIVIGDINGSNDTAHSRGCAYIQVSID